MNKTGDLYRLDFIDGKSYIGACACKAEKRYIVHQNAVLRGSRILVHRVWRELGQPVLVILKRGLPIKNLWSEEKRAAIKYGARKPQGYNGRMPSDEAPGMLNKGHTKETKERMRNAAIQRFENPNERKRAAKASRGKNHSEETKERMRQAKLGTKDSKETREKKSKSHIGRIVSEEAKENMRKAWVRRCQQHEPGHRRKYA